MSGSVPAQRVLGRIFEHVVGELVGRIELVARDGAKRGEIAFRGCLLRRIIFVGDAVAEAVGIAQVAAEDGVQRIALQRASSLALNSSNSRSCALFSGAGAATGSAAGATGAGSGAGVVAQAASAAMDAPRKRMGSLCFMI